MKPLRHTPFEGCCSRPADDPVHRKWSSIDEIIREYDQAAEYRRANARIKAERAEWDRKRIRRERKETAERLRATADEKLRELGRRVRIALGGKRPAATAMFLHEDGTAEWISMQGLDCPETFERYAPGQAPRGMFSFKPIEIERWVRRYPFQVPVGPGEDYRFYVYTLETAE